MLTNRLKDVESSNIDHLEKERKMRKEIDILTNKNSELELKLVEAFSQNGSEGDGISLAASDSTIPIHMTVAPDERIQFLERELNYYRTQYELLKINDALKIGDNQTRKILSSQSSTSSSISVGNNLIAKQIAADSSSSKCETDSSGIGTSKEQTIYDYFTKRFDELFNEKCKSDSKAMNYIKECESLKENVEILLENLQQKEAEVKSLKTIFTRMEEDFSTTKINYDEQIQVLTEQVLSLSCQLASID
jgi:protein phosphatase 1 regulatory subunit 21